MKNSVLFAALFFATPVSNLLADTYDCQIEPARNASSYKGVTPSEMRVTFSDNGTVSVQDDVTTKAGMTLVNGKLGRMVGTKQLFSWTLSPVPRKLFPPTETKFYEPTVHYRARLDVDTGVFTMTGSFVTRLPSANTGLRMTGVGSCQRS